MEIAQEAAGGLLDPYPLAHLAGARFQQLDLDAVLASNALNTLTVLWKAEPIDAAV